MGREREREEREKRERYFRITMTFLSAFGINDYSSLSKSSLFSSLPFSGLCKRSLKEDYPLWIASMWILWRQQPHNANKISTSNSPTRSANSRVNDRMSSSIWHNIPLIVTLVDTIVLGSLLVYKKSKDRNYLARSNRRDENDGDDNNNNNNNHADGYNNPNDTIYNNKNDTEIKEDTTSIEELRRCLKENSIDFPEQLSIPRTTRSLVTSSDSAANHSSGKKSPLQRSSLIETTMAIAPEKSSRQRYFEMLVHNVSHTDLVLSLDVPVPAVLKQDEDNSESYCLCQPRFSAFDAYSQRLVDFMTHHQNQYQRKESLIRLPQYERNDETRQPEPSSETTTDELPIGFRLKEDDADEHDGDDGDNNRKICFPLRVSSSELNNLRVRGRDVSRVYSQSSSGHSLNINAVFFPLLATLIPLWQKTIKKKYADSPSTVSSSSSKLSSSPSSSNKPKQVVILVSGVGQPRNWTHSVTGNSTQQCAELMKIFLQTIYPELIVVHIHSNTNLFRYDGNIAFVQQELLPRVQEYRDAHAKGLPYPDEIANLSSEKSNMSNNNNSDYNNRPFSTEWRKSFFLTLSFADGSSARNHAIQAALRTFKPTYYHFWQLKTFWHESKIVTSDIEVHSFEEMETLPPVGTSQLHDRPIVNKVVSEMKEFRDDFVKILSDNTNEIRAFWLRKTHKPVIAVLAVQTQDDKVKLYRGTNMEVSMPTGSLCAERNVIGTALADNPSLRRQDLKVIAVLAVPNPKQPQSLFNNGMPRPQSTNSIASQETTLEDESSHSKPPFVSSRKSSLGEETEWIVQDHAENIAKQTTFEPTNTSTENLLLDLTLDSSPAFQSSTPVRRINLYNKPHHQTRKIKRTVVVQSNADINPLRPCGACNEWLKKVGTVDVFVYVRGCVFKMLHDVSL